LTTPTGPLAGVTILDLSTVVLGPYATQLFGDMGADVIKVENGAGDIMRHAGPSPAPGMGAIYMGCNRNKRSIVLDLKTKHGMEAIRRLAAKSDVFFTNVRMDGLKRLGLGYDDVKKLREDTIYVHCAGYGEKGAYAGKPAYDDLIQAGSDIGDYGQFGLDNVGCVQSTAHSGFDDCPLHFAAVENVERHGCCKFEKGRLARQIFNRLSALA
jgi:crotonobetainyl-CoA:carnitine CoA-transferase CaiB-like acyl-CoA transferase